MNFNPWHHVPRHEKSPEVLNSIIEIAKGSRAKYELDKETGLLRLDRVLYSAMYYPSNYGFIPKTYCDDNDPLDILVLSQVNFEPLCLVEATPIGVMRMLDQGEADDKIIAVATHDIAVNHIKDIDRLSNYLISEIANFFEDYKKLENKQVRVEGFQSRELALQIIDQAYKDYEAKFGYLTETK
jgi:inorganic pyrophosphatase